MLHKITKQLNRLSGTRTYSNESIRLRMVELGFSFRKPVRMSSNLLSMKSFKEKLVLLNEFSSLIDTDHEFIFIDEMYMGGRISSGKEWVNDHNMTMYTQKKNIGSLSLIMAVTRIQVLHHKILDTTVTSSLFYEFIESLIVVLKGSETYSDLLNQG